ncbi:MAG: zinc ribbon domain-containing protein [archaeon]|nr:zinc ribbon domain-containing protein [archaeon]
MSIEQGRQELDEFGQATIDFYKWIWYGILFCWLLVPLIILFIKAINYYVKMMKAANATQDPELKKMANFIIGGIIISVIIGIISASMVMTITMGLIPANLESISPTEIMGLSTSLQNAMSVDPLLMILPYIGIIPGILSFLGYMAFDNFSQSYANSLQLVDGAKKLKISAILALVSGIMNVFAIVAFLAGLLSFVGFIFNMMGLSRSGKGLQEAFGPHGGIGQQGTQYQYQAQGAPIPSAQQPSGEKAQFCPNCGNQNFDNTNFCSKCGSPLS